MPKVTINPIVLRRILATQERLSAAVATGGTPGADGRTIYSGSGVPGSDVGIGGDFYFDTTSWDIYGPKGDSSWGSPASIMGPPGQPGERGLQGDPGAASKVPGPKGDPGIVPDPVYALLSSGETAMAFGTNDVVKVTPNATATFTTTVPAAGKTRTLIILTSGTTSRVITFGSGFKPTGTLATGTTNSRVFVIHFTSDGTSLYESWRTAAMAA